MDQNKFIKGVELFSKVSASLSEVKTFMNETMSEMKEKVSEKTSNTSNTNSSVVVNGNNVSVNGGIDNTETIMVNGIEIKIESLPLNKTINIFVTSDKVETVKTINGNIQLNGNAANVKTTNGNVKANTIGSAKTTNGNITI